MTERRKYSELLRDPRWQRRRLDIFSRANFKCESCDFGERTLNVHHKLYRAGAAPWQYADSELVCLCEDCHLKGHLLEAVKSADQDLALEEAIGKALAIALGTKDMDTRRSAFRVMTGLIANRSPKQVTLMEITKGLSL